ncbi:MAG: SUMF1/EgtB/PvdO family nonheme iron enzyme, partial [Bacteroidales bacterium]|nr:SUMF1/EgtB/PvdO family nonheme iron enzyme [Bacteroidales bacterium]
MKKILLIFVGLTLILSTTNAQKYAEYEKIRQDGIDAYHNMQYFAALRKFKLLNNTTIKIPTNNDISDWEDSCTIALENLVFQVQTKTQISDSLRNSVETAIFDLAATKSNSKDYFGSWNYQQIDTLDLSYSNLVYLPNDVKKCNKLKSINLVGNSKLNIDSAFTVIMMLPFVTDIKISVDSIQQIPPKYKNRITGIKINSDSLIDFPIEVLTFPNLKYLDISGTPDRPNLFDTLPDQLFAQSKLETLIAENCNLNSISHKINNLQNLKILKLSGNNMSQIPQEITQLNNLQILGIENNNFNDLPQEVCSINSLKILSCYNNNISDLPADIKQLVNLECLYLWQNNIQEIPNEICYLENLQDLRLYSNKMNDINPKIVCLQNLKYLDLSNNYINQIPVEIGQLTTLNYLSLQNNNISNFTPEITNLKQLKTLNLSQNKIVDVPVQVSKLTNLQVLNLDSNQITTLPNEITELYNLNELNVQNNKLISLPDSIGTMQNLQYVNFQGNSLPAVEMQKVVKSGIIVDGVSDVTIVDDGNSVNNNGNYPQTVFITGGTFRMGSNDGYSDEKPVHSVTVSDFYMGKYEVTNEEFCVFLNDYGSDKVKSGTCGQTMIYEHSWGVQKSGSSWVSASGYDKYPVIYVTWYGANEYCNWLSQKTGKKYRLPTEAEWEYAAGG